MVFEKIATLLANHFSIDVSAITPETTFESLGIDSLDTVELVMQLEEELGIEIELDQKLETVGELTKYVEAKLN
ncbi:MAG: acyl carrier protein [Clostridiales bacterium]|nr:acyl carrier protein [Clostridiales bacterium]